jgi:hypothetical protein
MSQEMLALASPRIHEVREEKEFYIPDYLSAGPAGIRRDAWNVAEKHVSDLREAEQRLDEAMNLVGVLLGSLQEAGDARAMQAETVLKIVENRLQQVHDRIDRHDTRFMNLFLAYFDLRDRAGGAARDD